MEHIEQKVEELLTGLGFRVFKVFSSGFNVNARFFDASGKLKSIKIFGPTLGTESDLHRAINRQL
jgi:hypothetical protein